MDDWGPVVHLPMPDRAKQVPAGTVSTQLLLPALKALNDRIFVLHISSVILNDDVQTIVSAMFRKDAKLLIDHVQLRAQDEGVATRTIRCFFPNKAAAEFALAHNNGAKKGYVVELDSIDPTNFLDGPPAVLEILRKGHIDIPRVRVGPLPLHKDFTPPPSSSWEWRRESCYEYEFKTREDAYAFQTAPIDWPQGIKVLMDGDIVGESTTRLAPLIQKKVHPAIGGDKKHDKSPSNSPEANKQQRRGPSNPSSPSSAKQTSPKQVLEILASTKVSKDGSVAQQVTNS
ncbi:hypothetical protein HDV00_009243 [Rhizophlyctis rosea]|nr:hypothetical protein HDV00_009243 [Rhizophlyctis rosea]